jgi:hypothetical protein
MDNPFQLTVGASELIRRPFLQNLIGGFVHANWK